MKVFAQKVDLPKQEIVSVVEVTKDEPMTGYKAGDIMYSVTVNLSKYIEKHGEKGLDEILKALNYLIYTAHCTYDNIECRKQEKENKGQRPKTALGEAEGER